MLRCSRWQCAVPSDCSGLACWAGGCGSWPWTGAPPRRPPPRPSAPAAPPPPGPGPVGRGGSARTSSWRCRRGREPRRWSRWSSRTTAGRARPASPSPAGGLTRAARPACTSRSTTGEPAPTGVRVRVMATPASLRPPDVPAGSWLTGDGDPPPGSPWRPVGPAARVGDLQPGRSAVVTFDWQVPADLPSDICLLAVATAGEPPGGCGQPTARRRATLPTGGLGTAGRPAGPTDRPRVAVRPGRPGGSDGRWGLKSLTVLRPGGGGWCGSTCAESWDGGRSGLRRRGGWRS